MVLCSVFGGGLSQGGGGVYRGAMPARLIADHPDGGGRSAGWSTNKRSEKHFSPPNAMRDWANRHVLLKGLSARRLRLSAGPPAEIALKQILEPLRIVDDGRATGAVEEGCEIKPDLLVTPAHRPR